MLGGVLRGGYTGRLAGCARRARGPFSYGNKKTALDLLTERRLSHFKFPSSDQRERLPQFRAAARTGSGAVAAARQREPPVRQGPPTRPQGVSRRRLPADARNQSTRSR